MKRLVSFVIVMAILVTLPFASLAEGVMKVGSVGNDVAKMQSRLIELGFLSGTADGNFGEMTKSAVIAFQEHLISLGYDVDADGLVGNQTLSFLYVENNGLEAPEIKFGSKGERVSSLQRSLKKLGLLNGAPDGVFGNETQAAVMEFQQAMVDAGLDGAAVTGKVDDLTLRTLEGVPSSVRSKLPVAYSQSDPLTLTGKNLYASSCVLVNADTGETLFEKNADVRCYPASTTKIMTLLLAVERGKLNSTISIPSSANEVPWDSSLVPVNVGETMLFKDLLYGLMIKSGNDAANAVATLISGSVTGFVDAMNKKAANLGMNDTHFANPHGYHDENHYTTARDMGILTCQALKNAEFKGIVSTKNYTMAATEKRKALALSNTYSILNPDSDSYYPYAYGIKTGYTSIAGQCYVGAAERNGVNLIAVVLHSGLERSYKWKDAAKLFEYGFAKLNV